MDAAYWFRNTRESVRFDDAIRTMLIDGFRHFIQVSPHPVLTLGLTETAEANSVDIQVVGTLRRDDGGHARVLTSLAEAYVGGVEIDWAAVLGGVGARVVGLPTYAFQRQRYWLDVPSYAGLRQSQISAGHDQCDGSFRLACVVA